MRRFFILLFTVLLTTLLSGQSTLQANFTEGELILQLHKNQDLGQLSTSFFQLGVSKIDTISERFNIFLLHFDETRATNQSLIKSLKKDPIVANAQNNHFVSLRKSSESIPSDSLYSSQWALNNTGQNGGIPGSDIDAERAWNITKGGFTAQNDEIIVAIIDAGSDLNHEDLSFWKNLAEIPDNGIDDDNNGFIDDFDGWNAYNHNGDIPLSNHGTHVGGIAGARGDNTLGISGINWNLKILPVAGETTDEATVVEALSYVFVVRERYDKTGGQEGAFVVANNCSFGVDKGQPEDYPVWEAMYDSLGTLGVLSVGATANRAWDIDVVGDIPTAFTTDFLISVTNTNQKDEFVNNAAYGDTSIDLSSPGQLINSTLVNNKYGYLSGTSMSAPHVTGAVALMFAAADAEFISAYKSTPDSLALLIKKSILNGTDPLEDLIGITVTGGRLNLFNSMNILSDVPSLSTYPSVVDIDVLWQNSEIDTLYVKNSGGGTLNYQIELENNANWISLSSDQGSLSSQEIDKIVMTFSGAGIDTGYYSNAIKIDGNDFDSQNIPVEMHVYTDVGIEEELHQKHAINVFPNPFSKSINLSVTDIRNKLVSLTIYSQTGTLVYSKKLISGDNEIVLNWDGHESPKGIYYYQLIIDEKNSITGKILKQ